MGEPIWCDSVYRRQHVIAEAQRMGGVAAYIDVSTDTIGCRAVPFVEGKAAPHE